MTEGTIPVPPLDDIREWVGVSVTVMADAQLQQVVDAELFLQAQRCMPIASAGGNDYTPALAQALYRRVARELAARGVPLGLMSYESEYGGATMARLPQFDVEVNRLEAPYRVTAIA